MENENRLRWTTIDIAVEDPMPTTSTDKFDNLPYAHIIAHTGIRHIETHAFLLKRLLKPMYQFVVQQNQLSASSIWHDRDMFPSVDSKIFVDMEDHTLWIAIEGPLSIDEFYKNIIANDLSNDKYNGYEIDAKPSVNMVKLDELKRNFVSWWCN